MVAQAINSDDATGNAALASNCPYCCNWDYLKNCDGVEWIGIWVDVIVIQ